MKREYRIKSHIGCGSRIEWSRLDLEVRGTESCNEYGVIYKKIHVKSQDNMKCKRKQKSFFTLILMLSKKSRGQKKRIFLRSL